MAGQTGGEGEHDGNRGAGPHAPAGAPVAATALLDAVKAVADPDIQRMLIEQFQQQTELQRADLNMRREENAQRARDHALQERSTDTVLQSDYRTS